ncbi:MAG: acyl-CoA synthetase [Deltaproteobacteria bacterium]|nr:acyl-CoA synthetase [Deltaproteobacteria bacterium]MBW2399986.1 acyl-CoA synthetase [Deltaproteobacteria bacterium]MBW2664813.1 acyl-CoA synthetase [Deltaproteobacteria bacterium]
MFNLAVIHEAIAAAVPERECLVFRDRRLSWSDVTGRTRRLADVLRRHDIGWHRERAQLENWESGQDHVALYLYNGNEYLEGMLGAYKAGAAPFNVNYRYVDEELTYLFGNADAKVVIYHACFAPVLARVRESLPQVKLWLQVADESGEALLPGAHDYEAALAEAEPVPPPEGSLSPDDLYILYTGGTTGMPKGVLWRQEDILRAALYSGELTTLDAIVERAKGGDIRALPTAPFMHGAAHWAAFNMWNIGGTIVVQSDPRRLDPKDIWSTVEREKVNAVTIVGDAFGRPLADELHENSYDLSSLGLIISGGAILTASLKQEFLELLPEIRILDALGSSESGAQATQFSTKDSKATTGDFSMTPGNTVLNDDLSGLLEPGSPEQGWLARTGSVPLGYYKDAAKTAKTFPIVDGKRYAVPGDRAGIAADGSLVLFGRDSVTINTGGEKVFAEEVEQALKHHPAVYDAVVVPTPHERWGQQVTAIVRLRAGEKSGGAIEAALRDEARGHLARYKIPKAFIFVDEITRSPSGKADYRWARETAHAMLGLEAP